MDPSLWNLSLPLAWPTTAIACPLDQISSWPPRFCGLNSHTRLAGPLARLDRHRNPDHLSHRVLNAGACSYSSLPWKALVLYWGKNHKSCPLLRGGVAFGHSQALFANFSRVDRVAEHGCVRLGMFQDDLILQRAYIVRARTPCFGNLYRVQDRGGNPKASSR